MQTCFEHFAATSLLGSAESPPRCNGGLAFARDWERRAFGLALALSKEGYFEWQCFRQALIESIAAWERRHALDDPSWNYYQRWLEALETVVAQTGILDADVLQALTATLLSECQDELLSPNELARSP
jgi:nitrile hydratase accessory protein